MEPRGLGQQEGNVRVPDLLTEPRTRRRVDNRDHAGPGALHGPTADLGRKLCGGVERGGEETGFAYHHGPGSRSGSSLTFCLSGAAAGDPLPAVGAPPPAQRVLAGGAVVDDHHSCGG